MDGKNRMIRVGYYDPASAVALSELNIKGRYLKCLGKFRKERLLLFKEATVKALSDYLTCRTAIVTGRARCDESALFVTKRGTPLDKA